MRRIKQQVQAALAMTVAHLEVIESWGDSGHLRTRSQLEGYQIAYRNVLRWIDTAEKAQPELSDATPLDKSQPVQL